MHLAEAYRSLARPSSALEPSHSPADINSIIVPLKLSKRLGCKAYTWHHTLSIVVYRQHLPFPNERQIVWCIINNGLAGI